MFQAQHKNAINTLDFPDGKYIILTKDHMTKEDFWYESLPTDILMITEEYPNVVVGHQMADCPILIAEDRAKGVTALAHCGASYIDRGLPKDTIQALKEAFQSNPYDIYVYIGSCAGKETYIYQTYPTWALHQELWNKHITQEQDGYHIDLVGAIQQQLKEEVITHIETSAIDTIKDPKFYSHKASIEGNNSKKGQNFVGFFYK